MCNFLNFSYGSQFEKRHKTAKKAHDHAGKNWAILPATRGPYHPLHVFISWL